jgi:hypothetical protein
LNPKKKPSVADAFAFQAHMVHHWLNDSIMPVLRTEMLCALEIDRSIRLDAKTQQYIIQVRLLLVGCALLRALITLGHLLQINGDLMLKSKTKMPAKIILPISETEIVKAWIDKYRPAVTELSKVRMGRPASKSWFDTRVSLTKEQQHQYLFVKKDGTGPRKDMLHMAQLVPAKYIQTRAPPHAFRSMRVSNCVFANIVCVYAEQHKSPRR